MSYILEALKRKEESSQPLDIPDIKALYSGEKRGAEKSDTSLWSYLPLMLMFFLTCALLILGYQWLNLPESRSLPLAVSEAPKIENHILIPKAPVVGLESDTHLVKPQIFHTEPSLQDEKIEDLSVEVTETITPSDFSQKPKEKFVVELPHLMDLPQAVQNALGHIEVKGHFYSTEPLHSALLVKEGYFYVGEEIKSGLILTEVTPKGAHFRYGPHDFQIAVVQNWLY